MSLTRLHLTDKLKTKQFVKEVNKCETKKKSDSIQCEETERLSGEKVKKFYENLLSLPSEHEGKEKEFLYKSKAVKNRKVIDLPNFKEKDLLFLAQNNDVKKLEAFIKQNKHFDINMTDEFGWTPLMCAACNGAIDAVRILLENHADPLRSDKFGCTALKLAEQKNWTYVVNLLKNYKRKEPVSDVNKVEKVFEFCNICQEKFLVHENHETSTLHLFNCKFKSSNFYGIPESNKGFQLLLKKGWSKGDGLGPTKNGRKFPVKAFPKKDRKGIGAPQNVKKERPKLTNCEKFESKKVAKWKEKHFERNFRMEFS